MDKVIRRLIFVNLLMIFLGLFFFLHGRIQAYLYLILFLFCVWYIRIKFYRWKIIEGILVVAFIVMLISASRNMFPFVKMLNINSDYGAIDSNWHSDKNNPYHNDVILYTIVHNCVCYTSQDSWYRDYLMAIGKKVVFDKSLSVQNSAAMQLETDYVKLGYSRAITNQVLYSEKYYHKILDEELTTGVAASVYINPKGIDKKRECVILNDEKGNIYVKAR